MLRAFLFKLLDFVLRFDLKKPLGRASNPIRGQDRGRAGAEATARAGSAEGAQSGRGADAGICGPCGARAHHPASSCSHAAKHEETCGSASGQVRGRFGLIVFDLFGYFFKQFGNFHGVWLVLKFAPWTRCLLFIIIFIIIIIVVIIIIKKQCCSKAEFLPLIHSFSLDS